LVDDWVVVDEVNDESRELLLGGLLHGVDAEEEGGDLDEGRAALLVSFHQVVKKLLLLARLEDGIDVGAEDEVSSLLVPNSFPK
jgi:hypothetical protein